MKLTDGYIYLLEPKRTTVEMTQKELIMCRSCKYWNDIGIENRFCGLIDLFTSEKFFCAFGEPIEEVEG